MTWSRKHFHVGILFFGLAAFAPCTLLFAQSCPTVPDDAFAFISGTNACPADPGVRWTASNVAYDCDFFADPDKQIDCNGDAATSCVDLCRNAANVWNADLPGRFTFIPATNPVDFCNSDDGDVSIGGGSRLCDGTVFGPRVLAVTLSYFFGSGSQAGQLIDADIVVNQAFAFTREDFQATIGHELGHVLGLDHPDACGDDFNVIMRSSSLYDSQSRCFVVDPTQADINGAARIYPQVDATPTPSPTPGECGDADQSGTITVSDGVQTLRAAAGLSSNCNSVRCDVDGSGAITVTDGVLVLRAAAGLSFAASCP